MDSITLNAYAKINLGLDVTARRPDGYHDVKMIMQTIGLYDTITIKKCTEPGIFLDTINEYRTSADDTESLLPATEDNIMYKAAKLFMDTYNINSGIHLTLIKRIPIAAGMAGGSTNAAAVFRGINRLFDMGLPNEALCNMGVKIGADVPYCIVGGTMLSEGIGELLTPLPPAPDFNCLIVKPDTGVSTKYVYEHLNLTTAEHPDIDALAVAIREKNKSSICSLTGNILENVTLEICPDITSIKSDMLKLGADAALMSGSGPTVFALFTDNKKADTAYNSFKNGTYGKNTFLTHFISDINI